MMQQLSHTLCFCPQVGTWADWVMVVVTVIALVTTWVEYKSQKSKDKYEVFAEYSKRYAEDENVIEVTKSLIGYMEGKTEDCKPVEGLSVYQKEMFMRFFEEIELQIENGRMDDGTVEDFFVYYAVAAAMCKPFVEGTELGSGFNDEVWKNYKRLIARFRNMQQLIASEYATHHSEGETIQLLIELPKECSLKRLFNCKK